MLTWPAAPEHVHPDDVKNLLRGLDTEVQTRDIMEHETVAASFGMTGLELEEVIASGGLVRGEDGFLLLDGIRDIVWHAAVDDFYFTTGELFGSLTQFTDGQAPEWSIPLDGGQTTHIGYTAQRRPGRERLILIGLDAQGQPSWALTAGQ